jgi:hypothetical protein
LSISTIAFFAFCRKAIFRARLPYKVFGIRKQNFSASVTFLEIFFKAHILNDKGMELGGFIYARNYFLTKDCADVISRIGLVIFFVDDISNVLIFGFVDFQVKYFLLGFS